MKKNAHNSRKKPVSVKFLVFMIAALLAAGIYKTYYVPNQIIDDGMDIDVIVVLNLNASSPISTTS